MLIWHIDETVDNNNNPARYRVDLEEAGGRQNLQLNENRGNDADYFRDKKKSVFTRCTTPNNRSYAGIPLELDIIQISPSSDKMTISIKAP